MNFFWLNYILNILKKYIKKITILGSTYVKLELKNIFNLFILLFFLKNHTKFKFNILSDIACIDFLTFKSKRFSLNYLILSYTFDFRLNISVNFKEDECAQSLINLYSASNWLEREIWDLFGIFFLNHTDLRRILTDYGFSGYPFRKDFPLNGFLELRYDENKQYLVYEPVELSQAFRFYDFLNPFKKYLF